MSVKVGLDFGTSNSGVAVSDGRSARLLAIDRQNLMPEVVKTILYITRDDHPYIGQEAVELYYRHNVNRVRRFVKKWVGEIDYRGADLHYVRDVFIYVDEMSPGRLLQYLKTALRKGGGAGSYQGTQIFDRYYKVVDLVQVYLRLLKQRAENELGDKIDAVTLGRPVRFNNDSALDHQAQETLRQAALEAGFKQVAFELEPIAAALYYEQFLERPQNALIFDFGGGTLDISILRLGDPKNREIFANGGIDIAGSEFDRAIIQKRMLPHFGVEAVIHMPELYELVQAVPDWIALPELSTPQSRHNLESAIRQKIAPVRLKALQSLIFNDLAFSFYNHVEEAKIALSSQGAAVISLSDQGIDLWELYARNQFEKDISEYSKKIEQVLLDTIRASGLEPAQINAVVKTGGSSSIPMFTDLLSRVFSPEKIKVSNAFSSVTAGLAIRSVGR